MADVPSHHLLHKPNNDVPTSDNAIDDAALEETKRWTDTPIIKYKGFCIRRDVAKASQIMEQQYSPLSTDIILASFPKTGTTWLKALTTSIINIHNASEVQVHNSTSSDPLSTHNPHELVPFLEGETFGENPSIDINQIPSPRVFNTHLPYSILSKRVKTSDCKVVYISRNPWDTFISLWYFCNQNFGAKATMEEASEDFCKGVVPGGPFFEHVLEFWQVRDKNNIFFITYEELKEDPHKYVKELAEFLNFPLCNDQVEEVVANCSFERLKKAEENRRESAKTHWSGAKFDSFYRKGATGDGKNHLSQEILRKIHEIGKQKWDGTGLEFKLLTGDN